jgi:hypothetical protein
MPPSLACRRAGRGYGDRVVAGDYRGPRVGVGEGVGVMVAVGVDVAVAVAVAVGVTV